jgi:hypothetical protein
MTYLRLKFKKDRSVRIEVVPINGVWHIRYKGSIDVLHAEATSTAAIDWIKAQVARNNPLFTAPDTPFSTR